MLAMASGRWAALLFLAAVASQTAAKTIVLTGATGRTGALTYKLLKAAGHEVRVLVRNATKAKSVLGCNACDRTEGVFVGDIKKPATMAPAMQGADTLVITVGPAVKCKFLFFGCKYLPGSSPKEINWEGTKTQVRTFANSSGPPYKERHVVILSSGMTTQPDNFLDKIDNGFVSFYALNGEAYLMSSGLRFTIVKACGLSDAAPGKSKLTVDKADDSISKISQIARGDVARVLASSVTSSAEAVGLRFDICKAMWGTPTEDVTELFQEVMFDWDPRKKKQQPAPVFSTSVVV